jgi:hypothetical protein
VGVSGQHHASAALYTQGKGPWYPLYRRLGGSQSRSGCRGYREKSSASVGDRTPVVQSVVRHYTNRVLLVSTVGLSPRPHRCFQDSCWAVLCIIQQPTLYLLVVCSMDAGISYWEGGINIVLELLYPIWNLSQNSFRFMCKGKHRGHLSDRLL